MTRAVDVSTRSAQTAMEIAAPLDAVWRALTDPSEIVRWFALQTEVEPGTGGSVVWRWADAYRWETRIEIWEPKRHLRLAYPQRKIDSHSDLAGGGPREEQHELIVDFELETTSGGTWLRCVHSGFGRDAAWDNELEGVRKGWLAELESLRHYLEHHRGERRRVWWAFFPPGVPVVDAWRAVVSRAGFDRSSIVRIDDDGSMRLAVPGLEADLVPVRLDPPGDLVARVPAWNDGMIRFWNDPQGEDGSMVSLFLSFYGAPVRAEEEESKSALLAALREALDADAAKITVIEQ